MHREELIAALRNMDAKNFILKKENTQLRKTQDEVIKYCEDEISKITFVRGITVECQIHNAKSNIKKEILEKIKSMLVGDNK